VSTLIGPWSNCRQVGVASDQWLRAVQWAANFIKISQTVAKIWRFNGCQNAREI